MPGLQPAKGALRPIVEEPPTTSDIEAARILAVHRRTKVRPVNSKTFASNDGGMRVSGGGRATGGSFSPPSKDNFA